MGFVVAKTKWFCWVLFWRKRKSSLTELNPIIANLHITEEKKSYILLLISIVEFLIKNLGTIIQNKIIVLNLLKLFLNIINLEKIYLN